MNNENWKLFPYDDLVDTLEAALICEAWVRKSGEMCGSL